MDRNHIKCTQLTAAQQQHFAWTTEAQNDTFRNDDERKYNFSITICVKNRRKGSSPEFERTQFGWKLRANQIENARKANHVDEKYVKREI